jgi:chromosome segregation ATPase
LNIGYCFNKKKRSLINVFHFKAESHRSQLNKLEQENEINEKKLEEFETRLNLKEREYISRRLTYEVYEDQLNRLKQSEETQNNVDNHLSIERLQQDIKQLSREVPKLKSQTDAIQTRIHQFQQRKQELIEMRNESKKLDQEIQVTLEDKILKENYFNRIKNCRDILRNIYKCRTTNDLPQKIFYDLPVKIKDNEDGKIKELRIKSEFVFHLDDLSRAFRIISRSIGRDWNRLYWQLPFHPTRGQEELSKDIQHINEKYQRGHVLPVNNNLNLLIISSISFRIKQRIY